MKIKSYGSGSSGNFYIVKNDDTIICIDCGIEKDIILKSLEKENIYLTDISGALITHSHLDHTKSLNLLKAYEIPIYSGIQSHIKAKLDTTNNFIIEDKKTFKIGSIVIKPIKVNHGDCECYSFILKDKENMIYFATDFVSIESDLSAFAFDEIWIECNYVDEIIEKLRKDRPEEFNIKYKRQLNVHCSLNGLLTHLSFMNLEKCKKIYLIHLSNSMCDKDTVKLKVQEEFDIWTYTVNSQGVIE